MSIEQPSVPRVERENQELAGELAQEQRDQARAHDCIARDAWQELGLLTPEELTSHLKTGKPITVSEHFLCYVAEDDMIWMTNPYGIDGILLSNAPNLQTSREFLTRIAMGGMYGADL